MATVTYGDASLHVDGKPVGLVEIDEALRLMWDRYALQPQTIWVDGRCIEWVRERVVIHWDRRNGWAIGRKS